jgi:hypothetical protein
MAAPRTALAKAYQRNVTVEWDPIAGAETYDVEITRRPIGGEPAEDPVRTNIAGERWTVELTPGTYDMRVRSRDKRKVPGEWSAPQEFLVALEEVELKSPEKDAKVLSQEIDEKAVHFEWKAVGGADFYSFELESDDKKIKVTKTLKDPELKLILPVARQYLWKVQASTDKGITSPEYASGKFSLWAEQLDEPTVKISENGFVREINWSRPTYTENFTFSLSRWSPEKKDWITVESEAETRDSQIEFKPTWPGGSYRLLLRANATLRTSSKTVVRRFNVVAGDRSPAAEANMILRQSIERTRSWYVMASYLVTSMDYKGVNSDNGGAAKLSVNLPSNFGGTGRIGLGYLSEKTPWGFLGILDLSGFQVADSNPTFASLEGNAVYHFDKGANGEVRQQFGLFYKEMPEIIARNLSTIDRVDKITGVGGHYGFEYWYAYSPKFGLQGNAHLYQTLLSVQTPTGNPLKPALSYQLGLLGSYRLNSQLTGLAGYAYRKDSASYESSNGSENTVEITGHYLNFFLEWAL